LVIITRMMCLDLFSSFFPRMANGWKNGKMEIQKWKNGNPKMHSVTKKTYIPYLPTLHFI
tara:strand:- start:1304 stop:1483 length:180 start_codon:yes stop_codon:yes gene_type:complete